MNIPFPEDETKKGYFEIIATDGKVSTFGGCKDRENDAETLNPCTSEILPSYLSHLAARTNVHQGEMGSLAALGRFHGNDVFVILRPDLQFRYWA